MARHARNARVGDVLQRIGGARVLGALAAVVVGHAGHGIHGGVLEHAAEADRVPDLRLAGLGQLDALGVAAALHVEHALVAPAVLVVTHQIAARIGAQRGLAGAGQAEEDRHVPGVVSIHVARAVHGEHALLGQVVVHRVEDALLHLARVARADDDHLLLLQALDDGHGALHAVALGLGQAQRTGVDDGPVLLPGCQVLRLGVDEQRLGEERVPRLLGEHAHLAAVGRIGAREAVEAEQVAALTQVVHGQRFQGVEVRGADGLIHLAPVDVAVDAGGVFQELVVGAAASAVAGVAGDGTIARQHAFTTSQREFNQPRNGLVGVHGCGAKIDGAGGGGAHGCCSSVG